MVDLEVFGAIPAATTGSDGARRPLTPERPRRQSRKSWRPAWPPGSMPAEPGSRMACCSRRSCSCSAPRGRRRSCSTRSEAKDDGNPRPARTKLLPAVHRNRDCAEGEPLRALLEVIAEQVALIEEDIERAYDNWFIETCEDWVVPYIGALVGHEPVGPVGEAARRAGALTPRREVANTIPNRARKEACACSNGSPPTSPAGPRSRSNLVQGWPRTSRCGCAGRIGAESPTSACRSMAPGVRWTFGEGPRTSAAWARCAAGIARSRQCRAVRRRQQAIRITRRTPARAARRSGRIASPQPAWER